VSLLSSQPGDSLGPEDIEVRLSLTGYALLDFSDANISSLIAEGRRAATVSLAAARCLCRAAATAPAARLPSTIGVVDVVAPKARIAREVTHALRLTPGAPLDVAKLRAALLAFPVLTEEAAIWLSPAGTGDTVDFRIVIERPHELIVGLGLAYDHDQGGRLWVNTGGRPAVGGGAIAWSVVSVDRFEQSLALGINHTTLWRRRVLSLALRVRGTNELVRFFDYGNEIGRLQTRDLTGFAGVEPQLSARWEGALGLEARTWREPGRTATGVGALVRLQQVDAFGAPQVQIEANLGKVYQRVSAVGELHEARLTTGRLQVIPFGRYGWGKHLPLSATFTLGGVEGFPGLALGERRGSREALAGLRVQYALGGGLLAELSGQGGATDFEGSAISRAPWLWGARIGLRVDTPVGSLRAAYGRNSLGRGSIFVRVGSWW
jgi:hypothetical protein